MTKRVWISAQEEVSLTCQLGGAMVPKYLVKYYLLCLVKHYFGQKVLSEFSSVQSLSACRGTVPLLHYPLTSLSGGNETALVCKPSPGSGARLCAINKSKCQSPRPASKASLPKEPGVATARARQHGQWSPRSHSRENNHPTLL